MSLDGNQCHPMKNQTEPLQKIKKKKIIQISPQE